MKTKTDGVLEFSSAKPGKTVAIACGVHGNEKCGTEALGRLLPRLKLAAGKLFIIYGNPRAIEKNTRQIDMNLNRAFKPAEELTAKEKESYERKRAEELMPYLDQSEALLDIHSSAGKKSAPFIICEPHSFQIAKQLDFPVISSGWDVLEPGGTDYYMNKQGKSGICAECGHHDDLKAVDLAEQTISKFLSLMGITESISANGKKPQRVVEVYQIYKTKNNFIPTRDFTDFEQLKEGELIGIDGKSKITAPAQNCIVFCRQRSQPNEEAFLLGRESLT